MEPDRSAETYAAFAGPWPAKFEAVRRIAPAITAAFVDFAQVPYLTGHIEPQFKALILLAVSASVTALHRPAIERNMANAVRLGASREQILEALELGATGEEISEVFALISTMGFDTLTDTAEIFALHFPAEPADGRSGA